MGKKPIPANRTRLSRDWSEWWLECAVCAVPFVATALAFVWILLR